MTNFAVQSRNLGSTQASLRNAGYRMALRGLTILIDDARAIDQPEDAAGLFVRAGTPPTHLAVEQEDLEHYFLRLMSNNVNEKIIVAGIVGLAATFYWWRNADQKR